MKYYVILWWDGESDVVKNVDLHAAYSYDAVKSYAQSHAEDNNDDYQIYEYDEPEWITQ